MIKKLTSIILAIAFTLLTTTHISADDIIYHKVSNNNMKIALTFDDGPHPYRTSEILEILDKYNIKATFFVIGQNIDNYPETFKQIIDSGHEIGNHTYSHRSLKKCKEEIIQQELQKFNDLISSFDCTSPHIIRPPGGLYDDALKNYAESNDYSIILWSVDTLDWAHTTVDKIVNNVLNNTKGGDIILMHDYISDKSPTFEAIDRFIPILMERGFEFVTVSELVKENAH